MELFSQTIEHTQSRASSFGTSLIVHGLLLVFGLVVVPLLPTRPPARNVTITEIAQPLPEPSLLEQIPARPQELLPKPLVAPRVARTEPVLPEPVAPQPPEPVKPVEIARVEVPLPPVPVAPAAETPRIADPVPDPPKPEVRTDVFGSARLETTTKAAPRDVQTGGFGETLGSRAEARPDRLANIGAFGSASLPQGPGVGNGSGGARGERAIVAGGFGGGASAAPVRNSGGMVKAGGFGDARPADVPARPRRIEGPADTPVEIQSKPRPEYTEAARKLRIEGEVVLEVVFVASGSVRVVRVLKGLGHGLDENAIKAAGQLRFKPAMRENTPVDSPATLRIAFQLAY